MAELELELPPQAVPAALAIAEAAVERAQAVRCGERWLAFPLGWARSIVEKVQLSAVPGAPAWLAGAANVEGRIVPVVDLAAWSSPSAHVDALAKDAHLLVGGEGEDAVAVLFLGLPRLVRLTRTAAPQVADDRLAPYVDGLAIGDPQTAAIDAPRLVQALIEELALP